jgi:branched-chain amino acid transport system permease protein
MDGVNLIQNLANGFINGITYSLLAIGFALVYNTTKIFHIAAAALYSFGAYMFYLFVSLGLPALLSGGIAVVLTMGLSWLIDTSVYQPLQKKEASPNALMIASLGVMIVVVNLLIIFFHNEVKHFKYPAGDHIFLGFLIITDVQRIQLIIGAVAITFALLFLNQTPWGIRFRALSTDRSLYRTLGYDERKTRLLAILMSGAFIAVGSCLRDYQFGVHPNEGMTYLIKAMVAMTIAGTGRFGICVLGGIVLGVLEGWVGFRFPAIWTDAVTYLLLILILLLRPQGIAGMKTRAI